MTEILVGYEVSNDPRRAGRTVSVPLKHTAVLGQTQESGKTTTQEAMITRSGLRAIAFLTKRGEQSFRDNLRHDVPPFFREATTGEYWKYVVSIVEGMMEVKLGFQERGWIIKLCREYERTGKTKAQTYKWKAPKTLRELRANVETALPYLRGSAELVCMQLAEYLDGAIPEIERAKFAAKLDLKPGINVMDISGLSPTVQALVIRSCMEWIYQHGKRIIVIVPEAWKFLTQGRQTPVKEITERLLRETAVLGIYVWIDSQDLRGVDKNLLRSVGVWLFGVQREKNEVANTLDSIPDLPKPSAADIMRLGKGQFFVAHGDRCVKTYVRPAGMEEVHAQAIARGEESADTWKSIVRTLDAASDAASQEEDPNDQDQEAPEAEAPPAETSRSDADSLSLPVSNRDAEQGTVPHNDGLPRNSSGTVLSGVLVRADEIEKIWPTEAEKEEEKRAASVLSGGSISVGEISHAEAACEALGCGAADIDEGEAMWKEKYEALSAEYAHFRNAAATNATVLQNQLDALHRRLRELEGTAQASRFAPHEPRLTNHDSPLPPSQGNNEGGRAPSPTSAPAATGNANLPVGPVGGPYSPPTAGFTPNGGLDDIYRYILARAAKEDPKTLRLLLDRPEIEVRRERTIIQMDDQNLKGSIAILIVDKFFDGVREFADVRKELIRRGFLGIKAPNQQISQSLQSIVELGFLTKEETGYQAVPGMKINIVET